MELLKNIVNILSQVLENVPWWHIALYLIFINCVTFLMYRLDKQAAIDKSWRIPESTLHMAVLIGGTFGAIVGQKKYRHKTKKTQFQIVFRSLVLLQLIVIITMMFKDSILVGI
jgi:uncharacterized membrane protein YsdA (DUF1294 family)